MVSTSFAFHPSGVRVPFAASIVPSMDLNRGHVGGMGPLFAANGEKVLANKQADILGIPCTEECSMNEYPNLPDVSREGGSKK